MGFIISVLVNAAALWVAVQLLDGLDFSGDPLQWLLLALIFGVVNAVVKPILKIFTFPITILTLGLFLLIINAAMLYLTSWLAGALGLTFTISSLLDAILGAIVIAIVGMALNYVLGAVGVD
jgi:putative membrane protein